VNGVFLLALCFSIFMEAIERFFNVSEISNPKLVVIVGSLGLASNIIGLFLFHGKHCTDEEIVHVGRVRADVRSHFQNMATADTRMVTLMMLLPALSQNQSTAPIHPRPATASHDRRPYLPVLGMEDQTPSDPCTATPLRPGRLSLRLRTNMVTVDRMETDLLASADPPSALEMSTAPDL
jgi:hypothetical protein